MTPAAHSKTTLRRHFRGLRQQRNDQAIGLAVRQLLLASNGPRRFKPNAGHLGLYWPLPGEADLLSLLPDLQGWELALPCSDGQGGMSYRPWDGHPLRERDGCGIPAPVTGPTLEADALQLLLVPALAVDRDGIRLGYGGGYYDRYLENVNGPLLIAVCYDKMVVDSLLKDEHDILFDYLLTERELRKVAVD